MSEENENVKANTGINPPASSEIGGIGGGAAAPVKAKWDIKGRRNLIMVGCVIGVAVLLMLLMFMGEDKSVQKTSVIPEAAHFNERGMISSEDRSAITASEKSRLEIARLSGDSAIEAPVENPSVFNSTQKPSAPIRVEEKLAAGNPPEQQQPVRTRDEGRLRAMTDQVTQQMTGWGMLGVAGNDGAHTYIREVNKTNASQAAQAGVQATIVNDTASAIIVEAFEKAYSAQTISTFDSDTPGTIRARLLTGPLAGAVLTGAAQRMGEGAHFAFTVASYKGKSFKINAEGRDEKTSSDVVEGNYNGRYAQRFVFPILAEGIKAYSTARAQTGTQVVVIPVAGINGSSGVGAQQTPPASSEQARQAMLAASADATAKALATTNQQPQVVVEMRKTIGILFLESVYESDLAGSKGGTR